MVSGARNRLAELGPGAIRALEDEQDLDEALAEAAALPLAAAGAEPDEALPSPSALLLPPLPEPSDGPLTPQQLRAELLAIRALLG